MDTPASGVTDESRFAAERSAVWSNIDLYLCKTFSLKTHLNTLTHIGQLPNEVLAEILVAYARDHYRSATRDKSRSTSPQWIRLAHVCRRWHEVALDTPRFWSYIYVRKPRTFYALLPLSKGSPLHIDLTLDQHNWSNTAICMSATELIGRQSHRLRGLCFFAKSEQVRTLVEKLSHPMLLLEKLVPSDRGGGDVVNSHPLHLLPATGHVPRIRHLKLHRLPFMWTDPVFCPTVTTLVVVGLKASWLADSPIGTFEQFLDALKAMAPSLVNLTLEESVPRLQSHTTDPPLTHGRSITLASLQTLRILCNTNDCVHLMDHLTVNPAATMDLTGNRGAGIERLVEILSAHVSRSTPLLGLKISLPRSTSQVAIAGYKDPDLNKLGLDDLGAVNLALSTSPAGERPLAAVLRAAGPLFSRVQALSILSEQGCDVAWHSLFACTPSVETLEIVGHPGEGFFKALRDVGDVRNGQSRSTPVPLLRLRELKFDNVCFRHWGRSSRGDGEFFDQLLDWAILRCN